MMNKKTFLFVFMAMVYLSFSVSALPAEHIQKYDLRYQQKNTGEKLVDNRGDGFEDLYGVRNFRVVLRGVVYRGGANNSYNKYEKRPNMNPLPSVGINNLCKEGFQDAVYLYSANFKKAPPVVNCKTREGRDNTFEYLQITAFDEANTDQYLKMIFDRIQAPVGGPIYLHCWNGWHASGVISALALRQFCDYGAEQALAYWIENTDDHSDGYEDLKNRIRNFKQADKYKISPEIQDQICF